MIEKRITKKLLSLGLLVLVSSAPISGCGTIGNPFIPKGDVDITSVSSPDKVKGVSVLQSFKSASGKFLVVEYKYNEPEVNFQNQPGLPRVIFKQVIVQYTLGTKKLPALKFPIAITIPKGGSFTGTIPVLSLSEDLINAVFPNGSFANISSGNADVTLLGIDDNGNVVAVKFTTPVKFETDPSNYIDLAKPADTTGNKAGTGTGTTTP